MALIDNGEFINRFYQLQNNAIKLFSDAKNIENTCDDVSESYAAYEQAFNAYNEFYQAICEKEENCNKINTIVDKDYKRKYMRSLIWNGIMGVIAVASLVFGIVGVLV